MTILTSGNRPTAISLRLPAQVKAAAEQAAEDSRSLASFVEKLRVDHLKAKDYIEPREDKRR